MTPAYDLDQAAAKVGLSGERFRKVWRWWVTERGFPHPTKHPILAKGRMSRTPYAWDAAAVDAWSLRQSAGALRADAIRQEVAQHRRPANDAFAVAEHPLHAPSGGRSPALNRRLAAERAQLNQLIRGA